MQTIIPLLTTPQEGSGDKQSAQTLLDGFSWSFAMMSCEGVRV